MSIDTQRVTAIIKQEIKDRRIKYDDLAKELGMSTSGLKKILAAKDLSLIRLQSLCDALRVPILKILEQADDERVKDVFLSETQEKFLLENLDIFRFYWKVRFELLKPQEYRKRYKVTWDEIHRYVRELEKMRFLKIKATGDFEFSDRGSIRWQKHGPLVEHLNRQWSKGLLESIFNKKDPEALFNLSCLLLSPPTLQSLKKELKDLIDKYSVFSQREAERLTPSKLKTVGFMVAAHEYQFMD